MFDNKIQKLRNDMMMSSELIIKANYRKPGKAGVANRRLRSEWRKNLKIQPGFEFL